MKNIHFISILSLFLMSCSTHRNVVVINGSLSDFPADSSSYVYLFQLWDNQVSLVDSAKIAHGEFKLVTQISESTDAQLIIPGIRPIGLPFITNGDHLSIQIASNDAPTIKGSKSVELYYEYLQGVGELGEKYVIPLEAKLLRGDIDTVMHNNFVDSLKHYKDLQNTLLTKLILSTDNPAQAVFHLHQAQDTYLSKASVDSILSVLNSKFPQATQISNYGKEKYPPMTDDSHKDLNYMFQLLGREPFPASDDANNTCAEQSDQIPYKIGDQIQNITFNDAEGQMKSIQFCAIVADYTLIDFWATWCNPCLKQIPVLQELASKYKGKLFIYAISIDKDEKAWKNYIAKSVINNSVENVILPEDPSEYDRICNLFGVKTIPHNILIDRNLSIIGINMSLEQLELKLRE